MFSTIFFINFGRGETIKTKIIIIASMMVCSILLAGCISEESNTNTINANLEKEPIGTYNNPAKVGDVVRVKYEFLGNSYMYGISVENYIRGDEANNIIKNANMFNDDPKNGYEYLLVKVKVKYVSGEEPDNINPFNFKVYINGAGYDDAFVVLPNNYPKLELVKLMPGSEVEGWLAYEVPKNKEVLIGFEKSYDSRCFIKIE